MKILKGKEQLGQIDGIPLVTDWDYLAQEVGQRKEEEKFERALGRLIFIIAAIITVGCLFVYITSGDFNPQHLLVVDETYKLLGWLSFGAFLYSYYLNRNRDIFLDRLRSRRIHDLLEDIKAGEKPDKIEVTDYFDHDLLNLIDDILGEFHENFLPQLMLELLEYPYVVLALSRLGLDLEKYKEIARKLELSTNVHIDTWIKPLVLQSFTEAYNNRFERVDELALFLYLTKFPLRKIMLEYEVGDKELQAIELWARNNADKQRYIRLFKEKSALKPTSIVNRSYTSAYSPTLMKYSRDFTAEVVRGQFTMSIAREAELEELINEVQEGESSATLVVGEPGVGKTTLLKSLAVRMVVEDVPQNMKDMRLVSFDFSRAFALSSNIERFKAMIEKALIETAKTKNIILVIYDLDELVNIRKEFSAEVVSLVTKAMDQYKLRLIATTTPEGYARHIKPFKSLAALFETVDVNEPPDEVAVMILMDILPKLEGRYGIRVAFETLVKIVKLSQKYDFDRVLPDKAIALLEEAMVKAQNDQLTFITESLIEEIVSSKVGVKVGAVEDDEVESLVHLDEELHKRVIGQDEAVQAVASALRRSRAGLTSGTRPIASFLFFGPTGVGKTELAKAVAAVYYGDSKLMIRVDMSEYQEERNLTRLIGSPVEGEFEGGFLTEAVRTHPFSIVLLDEIEKANPKVLDLFLQVLDEGSITDGLGRKVDFTNTIIVATSNVASSKIADLISKGKKYKEVYPAVLPEIRKLLRVEFINRFDRVVMFKPLLQLEVEQIAQILMEKEKTKLEEKGINLVYTKETLQELAEIGYNPMYGARELRRVLQDTIEDKIATLLITKQVKSGGEIIFNRLNDVEVK